MLDKTVSVLTEAADKGRLLSKQAAAVLDDLKNTLRGQTPKNRFLYVPLREAEGNVRDLLHASENGLLTPTQVKREARQILRQVITASEGIIERAKHGIDALAVALGGQEQPAVLGETTDLDPGKVKEFYAQTAKVPTSLSRSWKLIPKVPLVVLGLYGERLAKLRAFLKVSTLVESYIVVENQMLFGISQKHVDQVISEYKKSIRSRRKTSASDDEEMYEDRKKDREHQQVVERVGNIVRMHKKKKGVQDDEDVLHSYVNEVLSESPEPLSVASETSHMHGSVRYFWVMPTRKLNAIITKVGGNFSEEWDLVRKSLRLEREEPKETITDETFPLIFRMAKMDKTVEQIAAKVGFSKITGPALVARILLGEEYADQTKDLRDKYRDLLRKKHQLFVKQKQESANKRRVQVLVNPARGVFGPNRFWRPTEI